MNASKIAKAKRDLEDRSVKLPGMKDRVSCPLYIQGQGEMDSVPRPDGCVGTQKTVDSVIIHLNDNHHWTRQQIAIWLQDQHDEGNINIALEEELFQTKEMQ